MLIEDCGFYGPVVPSIVVHGAEASCPVCSEVIYPALVVLRNHDLHNWGHSAKWYSRDLDMVVHGCGAETSSMQVEAGELSRAI